MGLPRVLYKAEGFCLVSSPLPLVGFSPSLGATHRNVTCSCLTRPPPLVPTWYPALLVVPTGQKGCHVGKSGSRPTGSTETNCFDASKPGGRPTKMMGFG